MLCMQGQGRTIKQPQSYTLSSQAAQRWRKIWREHWATHQYSGQEMLWCPQRQSRQNLAGHEAGAATFWSWFPVCLRSPDRHERCGVEQLGDRSLNGKYITIPGRDQTREKIVSFLIAWCIHNPSAKFLIKSLAQLKENVSELWTLASSDWTMSKLESLAASARLVLCPCDSARNVSKLCKCLSTKVCDMLWSKWAILCPLLALLHTSDWRRLYKIWLAELVRNTLAGRETVIAAAHSCRKTRSYHIDDRRNSRAVRNASSWPWLRSIPWMLLCHDRDKLSFDTICVVSGSCNGGKETGATILMSTNGWY